MNRNKWINTLKNWKNTPTHTVISAIQNLSHCCNSDDKKWIYPLLESSDPELAAWALLHLCITFNQWDQLREFIFCCAMVGDQRDVHEEYVHFRPLQRQAISLLSHMAASDSTAGITLQNIATSPQTNMVAYCEAWERLAGKNGVHLSGKEIVQLQNDKNSEMSRSITERIRKEIITLGNWLEKC